METLLPKKTITASPIVINDVVEAKLTADPSLRIDQTGNYSQRFPRNSDSDRFGSTNNINQSTSFNPVLTGSAPTNAATGAEVLVTNTNEDWLNRKWRPAMGWVYMLTCVTDFIIFPILWSILQAISKGQVTSQWQPITLQGAGLYHIAMGAVLGIAAYGRTKEKMADKF